LSVKLSEQARIRLINRKIFLRFSKGKRYRNLGRGAPRREMVLQPVSGHQRSWHLVIFAEYPEVAPSAEVAIFSWRGSRAVWWLRAHWAGRW